MAKYKNVENIKQLFDEKFKKTTQLIQQGETHLDNLAEGFLEADRVISKLPTADVVEVRHGYWIDGKCGHYKICSECNQIADFYFDYCPNCGAKMDGKDGE